MPLRAIRSETSLNVQTDSWLQERNFLVLRACSKLIGGNTPCPAAGQSAAFMGPLVMSNPALQLYNNHAGWSSCQLVAWPSTIMWWKHSLHPGKLVAWQRPAFFTLSRRQGAKLETGGSNQKGCPCCQLGRTVALWDLLKNLNVLTDERNPSCAATANDSAAYIYINKTALTESFNALRSKFLSFEYMLSFPTLRPPESHRGRWRVQSLHDPKRHSRHTEGWKSDQHNESAKKYLWGNIHLPGHQSPSKQSRRNKLKLNSLFTWRTMNQITKHDFYDTKTNHEALLLLIIVNKWTAVFHCFW